MVINALEKYKKKKIIPLTNEVRLFDTFFLLREKNQGMAASV